jgi:hypothetical protein
MAVTESNGSFLGADGLTERGKLWAQRHAGPLTVFVILSGLWTVISWPKGVEHCTSDLWIYFGMVLKGEHPELFGRDLLFGDPANYAEWPLFTAFLRFFYRMTGDLAFGLKVLTFPLNLLFMAGAFAVFLDLTRVRWAAAFLAALASLPMGIPASAEIFGIGPATLIVPRTLFTAAFPLLWWTYVRGLIRDDPRLLNMAFLAVGLLANVHGISAFLLTQILLVVTLFHFGLSRRSILRCIRLGLLAGVGALPLVLMVLTRPAAPVETAPVEKLLEVFQARNPYLYPQAVLLGHLPEVILHVLTIFLLVAIPVAVALYEKNRTDRAGAWLVGLAVLVSWYLVYSKRALPILVFLTIAFLLVRRRPLGQAERIAIYFGLVTFLVGVGGVLVLQGLYLGFGIPPFAALHQFRAIRFSGFVVFALAAMEVAWLSSSWWDLGVLARRAFLLLCVIALGVLAREVYRTNVWTRRDVARDDLMDVASWAKASTPRDALFLLDSPLFRVVAQRSLVASTKDIGMLFMVRRHILEASRRVEAQRAAGDDVGALARVAEKYGADYVVVRSRAVQEEGGPTVAYRNSNYAVLSCRTIGCG